MGRRHDNLVWAASLGLAAAGGYLIPSITAGVPLVRPLFGVRDRLACLPGAALTFDDGPHPEGTPAVLELLAQAHARATFFLAGEQVEQRPALAAEIVAAGHEVALHCHRHRSLLRLAPWQVRDDLQHAAAVIGEATGREPRFYRPPYGVLNSAALAIARQAGWETVLWRREGHDWEARATADSIARRLTRKVRAGDVLLLHDADFYSAPDSWRNTVAALPLVLEELERRGLQVSPLDTASPSV
jgi:peptidoglycan/xylan/chitin deacetylase (PgdA/CDA1 family)